MRSNNGVDKTIYFLAGAGLGMSTAFLFGTRSGRRMRRNFQRWAEDSGERISDSGKEILEKSREVIDQTREMVDRGWRAMQS